ncbi:fumarylacetoacetase [Actinospongicola halichondriae]|uniref:fumarylacetoacetase n=1 Tax=Actinospongicola halichondriae TaxID=3236844 RepID=UPI003D504FF0
MTWIDVASDSDFPVENLPIGVVRVDGRTRVATRVGDHVVPIGDVIDAPMFEQSTANDFLGAGPATWTEMRERLTEWLTDAANAQPLRSVAEVEVLLPVAIGDYVDFYSSIHHATRVGRLFRPDAEPLLPNWRHLPIGYHGRAGTIVASGTPVARPAGLIAGPDEGVERSPSRQLDYEAEVGFVVGVGNDRADPVDPSDADRHVFGAVLVNDWSARDIQSFEYQPLGPFLGKSFATTISPWIVPLAALAPHRAAPPVQDPPPDAALRDPGNGAIALRVEAALNGTTVCGADLADLYWTFAQQFAHLTSNGASTRPGDLFATGTVSGPGEGASACLLEATERGARPVVLDDGTERSWLEDGDEVTLRAWAGGSDGPRIGFGEATGRIVG